MSPEHDGSPAPLALEVRGLDVAYGSKAVLHEVSLEVGHQEIVALIGANGAGKSTLLKAVTGIVPPLRGSIRFLGQEIAGRAPHLNAREGIVFCPQGGQAFRHLSVEENLAVAAHGRDRREVRVAMEGVYELFPHLGGRRAFKAGVLSGGERQMLALGLALMLSPRLFLIDEPSGGLAPMLVAHLFDRIRTIGRRLRTPILLVEQNLRHALALADRLYVLRNGRIVFQGSPGELRAVAGQKVFGF
ncbi:MAG: ABC transporter ATP-binding protein [Deltaproteobacteria bacterium]|nr:ABC transporter ATP-binding protein [Deltaproteobacteria bacterium]